MNTSKIIKGVVGGGRYTVTAPIVKEDYGLYLKIEGLELPSTYEVDFSNSEHSGTSVTMIGNSDGVLIPSQFISSGKDIFAFLYHVGDDYGRTVYKFRIPNKLRPDRTDETPTPEEQSTIDQAINALNTAVEKTAQDVIDADASAQSASADADRAEEAKTDAQNFATQAEQSATSASQSASQASASATASANSASQSAQIKADVEDLADDAQGYAQASAQSASASANSASQAQGYAQSASASAQSASGYASNALTYANTASTKATEASTSAQTASTKATESAQSALSAQGYAQTAEQAKTDAQTAQGLAESARDLAQGYAEDAQGYANDAQASAEGISASASQIAQNTANILKAFPTDTASGAVASFSDGADGIPLKSLVVDINPIQDLSNGDPSPENICPISGWTEVNVNHSDADMTNPTTLTIQLGQTVYGGKLDVLSGELVINMVMITLDGSNYESIVNTTSEVANTGQWDGFKLLGVSKTTFISDKLKSAPPRSSSTASGLWEIWCSSSAPRMWFSVPKSLTNLSELKAYLAENPIDVVYPLATPLTIQLTPNQVNSLYGQNNIWADSGDTEVVYRADTKLFIEKLTAPDSADMIADANITSGQYFMVGNSLYKATANIANGGQIIVGTNCIRKSLSEALNEINA